MAYTNWQQRIVNLEKELDGIVIPTHFKSTKFYDGTKEEFEAQDDAAIQEFLKDVDPVDGVVVFKEQQEQTGEEEPPIEEPPYRPGIADGAEVITSSTGCEVYRHSSGDSCVLCCNNSNPPVYLRVWDARYRGVDLQYSTSNTDVPIIPNYGDLFDNPENDKNTSKYNTDCLVKVSTCKAAIFCRNLGADLPQINKLILIAKNKKAIDKIDPTVASYSSRRLENWGFGSTNGPYVWSSTEGHAQSAWMCSSDGSAENMFAKDQKCGVIPVLELE